MHFKYKTNVLILMTVLIMTITAFAILNTSSTYAKNGGAGEYDYEWVVDTPGYLVSYIEYGEIRCTGCEEVFNYELEYVLEDRIDGRTVYGSGETFPGEGLDGFYDSGIFYCITPAKVIKDVDGGWAYIPVDIAEHFETNGEGDDGCIPKVNAQGWDASYEEEVGHWEKIIPGKVKLIQAKTKPVKGNKTRIILKIKSSPKKLSYYQVKLWRKNWQKTYNASKNNLKGGNLYAVRNLEIGKSYRIKVRAVKQVDGINYYGPWSNVKIITLYYPGKVKLVRAKTKAVKGNKTQIILKIKSSPKKLSYYQVKLWRKNWQKTYNVRKKYLKGGNLYSFGSLKKGKYKIKVRAVKKVDGVKCYGPWSNVKIIKGR